MRNLPKCCSLPTIDVARFTPITRTLQTRLHRLPRTLEQCALIPSLSCPEPTPWAGPAPGDHFWPQPNP
ncbi:hypothetical protein H5410_016657 [Solanum commersonii]|uniref:Uncharacterized protein n=1 Tax=Solanum commersonii TaxID=4109 RepID=A0A9J5ZX34_SOLCO|nr:hypothetical protein H5410_016657 [Solanum commersonii]